MRAQAEIEFVVEFPGVDVSKGIALRSLSGPAGRWDVVCRCIAAARQLAGWLCVGFLGFFTGGLVPLVVRIGPGDWMNWPASEYGVADRLSHELVSEGSSTVFHVELPALQRMLFDNDYSRLLLAEDGVDHVKALNRLRGKRALQVFIGDVKGLSEMLSRWLSSQRVSKICLGPKSYLTSQCITLFGYQVRQFFARE